MGRRVALLAGVAGLIACGSSERIAEAPQSVSPLRLVSLSRAASEFLLALGAGEGILAVDRGSSEIPALRGLPIVDLAGAGEFAPDVILVPEAQAGEALRSAGFEVIVYAPHDLEEALALCRDLGARLVGTPRARAFEVALSRELAGIGGSSFGRPRPRVAGLIGPAPLSFAGGHSFITDFIEIAGASSVTHGGEETQIPLEAGRLRAFAPDLLLVVSPGPISDGDRDAIQRSLPAAYRVEFFVFDAEHRWMHEAADAARRLRAVIEPLSEELERTTLRPAAPAEGGEGGS
ncbi:MAG TPA: hypothetical protein VII72_08870 [Myxococcota bacterium]